MVTSISALSIDFQLKICSILNVFALAQYLSPDPPPTKLLSLSSMVSVVGQMLIFGLTQVN